VTPRSNQMKKNAPHPKSGRDAEPSEIFVGI